MAEYLASVRTRYPALSAFVDSAGNCAIAKQVHELTFEILKHLDLLIQTMGSDDLAGFLQLFVGTYAMRMNPVSLVKIVASCSLTEKANGMSGLAFLEKYAKQIEVSKDAVILHRIFKAEVFLEKQQNLVDARTEVDGIGELLHDPVWTHSVSGSVRGAYHLVASELYLRQGNNDLEFYGHLVKFLTYTPLAEIPPSKLEISCKQAAVIALVHPEINDFGELLSLPAFSVSSWTVDFLRAIHQGDFAAFESALQTHASAVRAEANLFAQIDSSLRRKLTMISLAELAGFQAPEKNRRLQFAQISEHCHVPITEVETLIMTTMGTGLVAGVIDQVESSVVITRVKPRMLNPDRIRLLQTRIEGWATRADLLRDRMAQVTPELLMA